MKRAILIAALLARYLSRRFASVMAHAGELARGNFRSRLGGTDDSEFGRLSRTLNETAGNLETTVAHEYEKRGAYKIVVKVIDILGNDTTKTMTVEVP